ncbi:hypothetical protein Hdeb2414_s0028g00697161 [Helianthus debilis subsp. tardiflorus]
MTIINKKTNGQFPSRKIGKTNVLRPVVNQSQMYEGASKKSLRMSNDFIRISIMLFMLLFFYLAFLLIGIDFNLVIMKLQSMLLGKSLHFLFSRLGWGGLILLAFLFFDPETMGKMMDPSGASGSGSGEGRGFRWTDLFGSSSTGSSETSVAPDPTSTHPGEPAAPIAEVYLPLQEDGQRRLELSHRLSINTIRHPLPDSLFDDIIETQFRTELQIEKALRSDRVQEDDFLEKRHQIRGVLFYPNGRAFSLETYKDHLNQIGTYGTHRSLPYRRLMSAIHNFDLDLDFAKIKRNR